MPASNAAVTEAAAESTAHRALAFSATAFVAALGCLALFLPPLAERTLAAPLLTAFTALLLAGAMALHGWFLGRAARRLGQSMAAWVGLSVVLFPLGSAAALLLLGTAGRVRPHEVHAM